MRWVGVRGKAWSVSLLLVGGCGSVESASTCRGSAEPLTMATGDDGKHARGLALDATHAYWTTGRVVADGVPSGGSLMRVALEGGAPEVLVSDLMLPGEIAVDAHNAYWIDDFEARLMSVPLAGGHPVRVATTGQAQALAIDATSAYWLNFDATTLTSAVMKAPLGGGAGVELAVAQGIPPGSLAVDRTSVYWTELDRPSHTAFLKKVSIDGGPVTTLLSSTSFLDSAGAIAVDPKSVYLAGATVTGDNGLLEVPLTGGGPIAIAQTANVATAIAVDSSYVYFSELESGSVKRVLLNGGTISAFSTTPHSASSIATNGTKACWAANYVSWAVSCVDSCP